MRITAVGALDCVRTISIVLMMVAALDAFRIASTVTSFMTELQISKATVQSSEWLVGHSRMTYAVNEDVRTVENPLHVFTGAKFIMPVLRALMNDNRMGGWSSRGGA